MSDPQSRATTPVMAVSKHGAEHPQKGLLGTWERGGGGGGMEVGEEPGDYIPIATLSPPLH